MIDFDLNMEAMEAAEDEDKEMGSTSKKQTRNPKWSVHETMVMLRGKYALENCKTRDRRSGVPRETESGVKVRTRWSLVADYCAGRGVRRVQAECKQRWQNLVVKFRKIWTWQEASSGGGDGECYWNMSRPRRREMKFPGVYNRQIYEFLAEMKLARGDVEAHDRDDEEEVQENDDTCSESDNNNAVEEDKHWEEEMNKGMSERTSAGAGLKRKANDPSRASVETEDSDEEMRSADVGGVKQRRITTNHSGEQNLRRLIHAMENNSKMLKARFEAQRIRRQEEREDRNRRANSLLANLSKIADAMTKIAEKL